MRDDHKRSLQHLGSAQDVLGGSGPRPSSEASSDPVEIWARRFGRGLAIVATIGLIAWAVAGATP